MDPSARVCHIALPPRLKHFEKTVEEQEAKATRKRADPLWLAGILLESDSWCLKMQFLIGGRGWESKAEDQNSRSEDSGWQGFLGI